MDNEAGYLLCKHTVNNGSIRKIILSAATRPELVRSTRQSYVKITKSDAKLLGERDSPLRRNLLQKALRLKEDKRL